MAEIPGWYAEFAGAVIARLPRDIDEATAAKWIANPTALEEALSVLRPSGAAPAGVGTAPLKNDKSKEGWQLLEDVTEPSAISTETIEIASFLREGEGDLYGDEMVTRVQEVDAKLGQRHAEYLHEHQEQIPDEWRKFALVFPGTLWLGSDHNHHVPCLIWRQGSWQMQFGIVEAGVDASDYLVRARQ